MSPPKLKNFVTVKQYIAIYISLIEISLLYSVFRLVVIFTGVVKFISSGFSPANAFFI